MQVTKILDQNEMVNRCHKEIAEDAKKGNRTGYEYIYSLDRVDGNVATQTEHITIYSSGNVCVVILSDVDRYAWTVTTDNVHDMVRDIMEETDYVLSYYSEEDIPEDELRMVLREDPE